jgi:hypothetical protein
MWSQSSINMDKLDIHQSHKNNIGVRSAALRMIYKCSDQFGERKRGRVSTNSLVDPTINHGASNPPSFSKPCLGERLPRRCPLLRTWVARVNCRREQLLFTR